MTVAALPATISYIEDGATIAFAVPFRFRSPNDLVVQRIMGGIAITLQRGVNYSVTGGTTDAGGTLTLTTVVAGSILRISRRTSRAQPMVYSPNDRFPAKSHEEALDRQMLVAQEQDADLQDVAGRALQLPVGEVAPTLPVAAARAGGVLAFRPGDGEAYVKPEQLLAPGAAGPANSTYASLAALKAAPVTNLSYILADGERPPITYALVLGDYSAKIDDRYYVALNGLSPTLGALVRDLTTVSVKDFGAVGDGVADDRPAIQAAIDFVADQPNGGFVIIPVGVYRMTVRITPDGTGVCALVMKNKVTLQGLSKYGSILILADNQIGAGAFLRIICAMDPVTCGGLLNFTIDGNRNGQGLYREQGNGGNIVLGQVTNLQVRDVVSVEANGQGIQIAGTRANPVENLVITHCEVAGTSGSTVNPDGTIALEFNGNGCGIQVSMASHYVIAHNIVRQTKDNSIDIYNENVDYTTTPPTIYTDPIGGVSSINNNVVSQGRVGIFPETSARVRINDNYIHEMEDCGIAVNRINSAPRQIDITNNSISNVYIGVRVFGDCHSNPGIVIRDNFFGQLRSAAGAAIYLYNTSNILIEGNTFGIVFSEPPLIRLDGQQVAFVRITGNRYFGNPAALVYSTVSTTVYQVLSDDWLAIDGLNDRSTIVRHTVRMRQLEWADAAVASAAPAPGGAAALPATPAGYVTVEINGSARQIPYY